MFPKQMEVEPAKRPLHIAVVYSRIPLPMRRADQMTVAHLLSFLKARGHIVDLFCVKTGSNPSEADLEWLRNACHSVRFYKHDWRDILRAALLALSRLTPLQVGLFANPKQKRDIHRLAAAGNYDIVYTYYLRSAEATRGIGQKTDEPPHDRKPATFLALQLSQALNSRRIAQNSPNLLIKALYQIESRLVARYESKVWRDFTHTILIGGADVAAIQENCARQKVPVINNFIFGAHGTDTNRFSNRKDVKVRPNHLVFSGVMRTPTNVQAVQWFATNVWPRVRAEIPDATWLIVGREPTAEVKQLAKLPGVEVTGTVSDTSLCIAEASVCINPMQAGGGMQNKLIEYMASGKAVVATSVANEGIGAIHEEHLIIADDPVDFAEAVIDLLLNPAKGELLGKSARTNVLANWTWESHFLKLEQAFYSAQKGERSSFSVTSSARGCISRNLVK
jgi:polysaccharide biosynthesis protein PslH